MKKETIYALVAGCAFFCLIFLGTFWYFSRSERAVTAAGETASAPSPAAEAIPAASPMPVVVPEKSAAPAGAPPAATEPRPPTPTAYGEAVGAGIAKGTSPYPEQVAPPDQEEEEGTRRRDRLHGSATKSAAEARAIQERRERLRRERAGRRTETPD
jgi:hypothetical protein